MRLASFTDYGLRTLMMLADAPATATTTAHLAGRLGIPYNHLTKVVQDLARGGYIATQRGAGGGMKLARPPGEIRLGEVVRFLEQRHAIVECFRSDGGACRLTAGCRVRARLAAAQEAFFRELDRTSIADCAHPGPEGAPELDLPAFDRPEGAGEKLR